MLLTAVHYLFLTTPLSFTEKGLKFREVKLPTPLMQLKQHFNLSLTPRTLIPLGHGRLFLKIKPDY